MVNLLCLLANIAVINKCNYVSIYFFISFKFLSFWISKFFRKLSGNFAVETFQVSGNFPGNFRKLPGSLQPYICDVTRTSHHPLPRPTSSQISYPFHQSARDVIYGRPLWSLMMRIDRIAEVVQIFISFQSHRFIPQLKHWSCGVVPSTIWQPAHAWLDSASLLPQIWTMQHACTCIPVSDAASERDNTT